jgi:hypothetical protein
MIEEFRNACPCNKDTCIMEGFDNAGAKGTCTSRGAAQTICHSRVLFTQLTGAPASAALKKKALYNLCVVLWVCFQRFVERDL